MGVSVFSRTTRLSAAGPTITVSSIPQTARHLMLFGRVRFDSSTVSNRFYGLRINGDAASVYRGNASVALNGSFATAITGSGYDTAQLILGEVNEFQAGTAGMFAEFHASLQDYAQSQPHCVNAIGSLIFDDGNVATEYRRSSGGGYHNSAVAVTSLEIMNEAAEDFAAGSSLTVVGLAEDANSAVISRAPQIGLTLDFEGPQILDYTASAGANNFAATNLVLGRTLLVRITGGDGTTTLGMPATTELLGTTYVAGADGWLHLTCVDESGPAFIARILDVV